MEKKAVTLSFDQINYSIACKAPPEITDNATRKNYKKPILIGQQGVMRSGQLCAIMGPSGGGKTTLLDVLAGRISPKRYTGDVRVNGERLAGSVRDLAGYVPQDDVVMGTLTVRENLMFSANLRLPKSMGAEEKRRRVEETLVELGLEAVANTKVGNEFIRGISGGERKRLSIGMELITAPSILFLDEPTTGLDATTANNVMKTLRKLANDGRCIICSIHQPRYKIFELFDHLILLAKGEAVYSGPAEECLEYFQQRGLQCEAFNNPADFFLDMIAEDAKAPRSDGQGQQTLAELFKQSPQYTAVCKDVAKVHLSAAKETAIDVAGDSAGAAIPMRRRISNVVEEMFSKDKTLDRSQRLSTFEQFLVLSRRAAINVWRNPMTSIAQVVVMIIFAAVVGAIYYDVGTEFTGIQNRSGAFFFLIMNLVFSSLSAIELFLVERKLFMHERSNNYYSTTSYFFAKFLSDFIPLRVIPTVIFGTIVYFMVGFQLTANRFWTFQLIINLTALCAASLCFFISMLVSVFAIANLMVSLAFVFFMVFGGFLLNVANIPAYFRWLEYLSIFRYAIESVSVNEFAGLVFQCPPQNSTLVGGAPGGNPLAPKSCVVSGDFYLDQQNFKTDRLWTDILALAVMTAAYMVLALWGLWRIGRR